MGAVGDVALRRDAANTLALRNSTNAQTFRVYGTYTDASNYTRVVLDWTGGAAYVRSQGAGTGGSPDLIVQSANNLFFGTVTQGYSWSIRSTGGHLWATTDNTYDIGASGANRPRDLFLGRNIIAGGYVLAGSSNSIGWSNRAVMQSTADGRILLLNSAGTDFSRLMIGGSTSSYPAIGRDNADLSIILADNSANTGLIVSYVRTVATVVASLPSAATAGAGARAFVTDATATTFASVVSGGGANSVPVYSDGTQWLIG